MSDAKRFFLMLPAAAVLGRGVVGLAKAAPEMWAQMKPMTPEDGAAIAVGVVIAAVLSWKTRDML
jgi:hypothetical protein